jgi:hypothetical protein
MSVLEIDSEAELTSEIGDLSGYLRGVPADLRESGAFTSYEVRLQQLLENLLTLRLSQALARYETSLGKSPASTAGGATYEAVQEWVRVAERQHERAADSYLRTATLLNGLVVAFGAAAGIGALASTAAIAAPLAGFAAIAGAAQLVFRPAEKSRSQQELAGRLEMLRIELENIVLHRSSGTSHHDAAQRVERALQLLNDTLIN